MIKFLLIVFIIIFLIARFAGYFFRIAFYFLGKKLQKEAEKQAYYAYQSSKSTHQKEGEITISRVVTSHKKTDNSLGEYVDFQEVK